MKPSRLLAVGAGLSLAVASISFAGSGTDLSWIGQIPGVTAHVQRDRAASKGVYTVSGDPALVFDKVRAGFVKNGWAIEKFRNTEVAGVELRTLVAVKEGSRAKAFLNANAGTSQLVVSTGGLDREPAAPQTVSDALGAAASAASAAAAILGGGEKSTARSSGARIDIVQNGAKGTYTCRDSQVTVHGQGVDIVLEGRCTQVVVNGSGNKVRLLGTAETIATHGNHNTVTWSAAAHATEPRVSNLGTRNTITRIE